MRMRRRHFAMTQCNYAVDTLQTDEQTDSRTAALLLRQTIPLGNYVTPHHLYAEPWRHRDVRQVRRHRHVTCVVSCQRVYVWVWCKQSRHVAKSN